MTQSLGQTESSKLLERIEQVEQEIDNLVKHIPPATPTDMAIYYLNLDDSDIKGLSWEECEEAGIVLSKYALSLQNQSNKFMGMMVWCDNTIKYLVAEKVAAKKGFSYEERKYAVIKEHETTQKLEKMRVDYQLKYNATNGLSDRVYNISRSYSSMAHNRKKYDREI